MILSASARSSVIHAHIVTSACGKPSAGLPAASSARSSALAAAKPAGVMLYADASHPSPSRATRHPTPSCPPAAALPAAGPSD